MNRERALLVWGLLVCGIAGYLLGMLLGGAWWLFLISGDREGSGNAARAADVEGITGVVLGITCALAYGYRRRTARRRSADELRWSLDVEPPVPHTVAIGHLRRRLNVLINANLREHFDL